MKAAVVVVHARDRVASPGGSLRPRPRVHEDVLDRVCNPTRFLSSAVRKLARRKCEGSVLLTAGSILPEQGGAGFAVELEGHLLHALFRQRLAGRAQPVLICKRTPVVSQHRGWKRGEEAGSGMRKQRSGWKEKIRLAKSV